MPSSTGLVKSPYFSNILLILHLILVSVARNSNDVSPILLVHLDDRHLDSVFVSSELEDILVDFADGSPLDSTQQVPVDSAGDLYPEVLSPDASQIASAPSIPVDFACTSHANPTLRKSARTSKSPIWMSDYLRGTTPNKLVYCLQHYVIKV